MSMDVLTRNKMRVNLKQIGRLKEGPNPLIAVGSIKGRHDPVGSSPVTGMGLGIMTFNKKNHHFIFKVMKLQ